MVPVILVKCDWRSVKHNRKINCVALPEARRYRYAMDKMHIPFAKARDMAGGIPALARIVERTPANLYSLFQRERPCPPQLVIAIERALGLPRHELRPDIYPPEDARAGTQGGAS